MHHNPAVRRRTIAQLMQAADELQEKVNQFIGLATMAEVAVPDVLYETNAELLRLSTKLRDIGAAEQPSPEPCGHGATG